MVSPYQAQGRWQHSSGGEIEIKVDGPELGAECSADMCRDLPV